LALTIRQTQKGSAAGTKEQGEELEQPKIETDAPTLKGG
jgi:hypothetical protein